MARQIWNEKYYYCMSSNFFYDVKQETYWHQTFYLTSNKKSVFDIKLFDMK